MARSCRPDKNNNDDDARTERLFKNLHRHCDKLQCHRKVKVINGHKDKGFHGWDKKNITSGKAQNYTASYPSVCL